MYYSIKQLALLIKETRNSLGITQRDLAIAANTGFRFIIELEKGKETCQTGKVLEVLKTLGIEQEFIAPNLTLSTKKWKLVPIPKKSI